MVAVIVAVNKLTNGRVAGEDFTQSDVSAISDFATLTTLAFTREEITRTRRNSQRLLSGDDEDSEHELSNE